jgi:hypothetical protein
MDAIQGNGEQFTNGLELLFSFELHYQGPIELAPMGDKVGTLVGGGDGTLTGPRMRGTVRWSNYETTGEDLVCALQVPGVIQTHDGAEIGFEGREFAMPLSDESKQWRVAGVLRFKTDDSRYVWLNDTFAFTSGTFDYESGTARWIAFVPKEGRRLDQLGSCPARGGHLAGFHPRCLPADGALVERDRQGWPGFPRAGGAARLCPRPPAADLQRAARQDVRTGSRRQRGGDRRAVTEPAFPTALPSMAYGLPRGAHGTPCSCL